MRVGAGTNPLKKEDDNVTSVFSWLIVGAVVMYIFGVMLAALDPEFTLFFIFTAIALGGVGIIGLLVCVIKQRLRDKESEEDVINKY